MSGRERRERLLRTKTRLLVQAASPHNFRISDMNIAYVTETWPPALNGAALAAARAVSHLRTHGHGVELVRPRRHADDAGDANTVTVPSMQLPLLPDLKIGLPVRQRLVTRWSAQRPDVVHIATQGPLGWSASSAARMLEIPVTSDFSSRFDSHADRSGAGSRAASVLPLTRAYLRGFHNRATCTFVASDEVASALSRQGFRNVVVSGLGVDTVAYSPLHRSESLRRRWAALGPVVLYVDRLSEENDIGTVIEAFDAIRDAEPSAKLVLVGESPMLQQLQARNPDAIFVGQLKGSMLAACYASADMLLWPSLSDAPGNVVLEAMASGLPVVAYDTPAAMHIQDEVNGIVVVPGDHFAFARAAVALAYDEPLRERLGAAACQTARSASRAHILADFEQALRASCLQSSSENAGACLA
jgi:glycosyltransferase involved in cell wall biosynthesis